MFADADDRPPDKLLRVVLSARLKPMEPPGLVDDAPRETPHDKLCCEQGLTEPMIVSGNLDQDTLTLPRTIAVALKLLARLLGSCLGSCRSAFAAATPREPIH